MRIMLLLGSGISLPSGLPRADQITDSLLNEPWHMDHVTFHPGPPTEEGDPTSDLQTFLKLLQTYADDYYALRGGQKANYEDIYYLAQQIRDDEQGRIVNPAILGFLNDIEAGTRELSARIPRIDDDHSSFQNMVMGACTLAQCVVEKKISTPNQIKGLELLRALASSPDIDRIDICTLNHDTLIERFLKDSTGKEVTNGFAQALGKSTVGRFDPRLFETSAKVRIFKLHGSIDWFMFADAESVFCGIPTNGNPDQCLNERAEPLHNVFGGPVFLAGTYNKIINYGFGVIAEM